MYTPAASVCTAPNAMPTLNTASVFANRAGYNAPVSTMVLSRIDRNARAVFVMVSVP